MNDHAIHLDRVFDLTGAICDEGASQDEFMELDSIMLVDRGAFRCYLGYCQLHSALRLELRAHRAAHAVFEQIGIRPTAIESNELDIVRAEAPASPVSVFLSNAYHDTIGYFSHEIPFSFLVGAALTSLLVLIAWLVPVSSPVEIGDNKSSMPLVAQRQFTPESKMEIVGRITGMADVKWADINASTETGNGVLLGRKYVLSSGLMEITYDTGAKVILQGPVTYEVESKNGGFLPIGKLTGKVEVEAAKGFSVRTPTATVTDLGTEFGVEVGKTGITETHVFLGKVRLERHGQVGNFSKRTLVAGEAARLDAHATIVDISEDIKRRFVRTMPMSTAAVLPDLIDQVDYGDTWSANSPTRAGSYLAMNDNPLAMRLEQCNVNPLRSWVFSSATAAMTTWPRWCSTGKPWPGFRVQGSRSGFLEMENGSYLGFEYGLRDDFVVQFDAVQTDDRITISIGDKPATIYGARSLSVFFRAPNTLYTDSERSFMLAEIGLHTGTQGERNTNLSSGIPTPGHWQNYAVRFNLREKRLDVWVNYHCRGKIELSDLMPEKKNQGSSTWDNLPWTNRYVTIGGNGRACLWTDNFRIGSPRKIVMPTLNQPPPKEK